MRLQCCSGGSGRQEDNGVMVIDMGTHILQGLGSRLLIQIAIPRVEGRARSKLQLAENLLQPGDLTPTWLMLTYLQLVLQSIK